jgi:hypothetical protein
MRFAILCSVRWQYPTWLGSAQRKFGNARAADFAGTLSGKKEQLEHDLRLLVSAASFDGMPERGNFRIRQVPIIDTRATILAGLAPAPTPDGVGRICFEPIFFA